MSAKSKIINNVRYITAKVVGKPVNISEASIRSDLLFDDADGIDSLHNQDHFPINALTTKVFSFMVKKGKSFSGNVTPLFPSMLAQPTEDEGAASKRPSETQPTPSPPHPSPDQHETQPDPSPKPSPTIPIPDSIPEGSGGNHGGQSSSDRSLSGNEDGLTLQSVYDLYVSLCKQVTDQAKEIKHLKAQIKKLKKKAKPGRKSAKSEPTVYKDLTFDDLNDVDVNDAMDYMETNAYMQKGVSTDKPEVTRLAKEINKKVLRSKILKISDRPRYIKQDKYSIEASSKWILKGPRLRKGVLEEEAESDAESEGVDEAKRKFDQLAKDEEIARKEEKMRAGLRRLNEESKDPKKKRVVNETPREEDTAKVPAEQEVTEQGTKKRKSGHCEMIASEKAQDHRNDD
ncbi:hypothetical protein Tco_1494373 [Tanacetum coccineum]